LTGDGERVPAQLGEVPETTLWTLYHRAAEARRADPVLADPRAVELVERIDYPFAARFGGAELGRQWQALRSKCFDLAVSRFLAHHPGGTVVALGVGLETQYWRVDDGRARWVEVDLPEVVAIRERLLPGGERRHVVAGSALDGEWMREVEGGEDVLVTAQGLLMYFQPEQVHRLLATSAEWLSGGEFVFDAIPSWLAALSRQGKLKSPGGYQPPPWHWGIDPVEERRLRGLSPHIAAIERLRIPRGRGLLHSLALPLVGEVPLLRDATLSVRRLSTRQDGDKSRIVAGSSSPS
jgi:O-methyltransferase involved in polyketide biosynthesis